MKILEKVMTDKSIGAYSKLVFSYLCSISSKSGICSKPQKAIKKELGIHEDTLSQKIKVLEKHGYIRVRREPFQSNTYILDAEQPEKRVNSWR